VQIERDKRDRAEIDAQYQVKVNELQEQVTSREEAIRSAANSTCPVAPAYRAYFDSVRREQAHPTSGGQAGSR
jgi:hypothetical protein